MKNPSRRFRGTASALAIVLTCLGTGVAQAQGQPSDEAPETSGLRDIVVSARRIEERLQDVPLSITAFDTQSLADNQISQVQDLGAQVPNVITGKTSVPGSGQVAIRGVQGQSLPRISLDNRVGVYLDGVYLARPQGQSFELADIQRIEVLKGPQGTLFGRNVTAGSINIITAAPKGELGGTFEVGFGSRNRQRYRATLELPEAGGFSARITYLHNQQDGYIRNLSAGNRPGPIVVSIPAQAARAATATSDAAPASGPVNYTYTPLAAVRNFGDENNDSLFAAVRYEGIDGLTVDYKFDYADMFDAQMDQNIIGWSGAPSNGCVFAALTFGVSVNQCGGTPIAFNGGVITRPGTIANVGGTSGYFISTGAQQLTFGNDRPDVSWGEFTGGNFIKSMGHNLTLNYEASDAINLRSITAYRTLKTTTQADGDGGTTTFMNEFLTATNPALYPASLYPAGGNTPILLFGRFGGQDQKQFSQEFQMFGDVNNWLSYLVGLYYFKESGDTYTFTVSSTPASTTGILNAVNGLAGVPPYAPNGGINTWGIGALASGDLGHVTSESKAMFGRVTLRPIENLEIVLGGRYTLDKKTSELTQAQVNTLDFNADTPAYRDQAPSTLLRQKFKKFTYDGTVTYHVTPDINVYGRYATAYLSGGSLRNTPFRPETTKAAEIGFKSELFDRRVRFNVAAFWQKSRDSQFSAIVTGLPFPVNTAIVVRNLGAVRVRGVEAELTAVPVRGLTLSGSVGYVDQKYISATVRVDRPQTPEWTLQGSIQYDTPPLLGDAYLSFRFDANYRSHYNPSVNVAIQNSVPAATGGTLPPELLALYGFPNTPAGRIAYMTQLDQQQQVGGFWMMNARVSIVDIPMFGAKGRLSGYVKNIINDRSAKAYTAPYGLSVGSNWIEPRNFGLDLSVNF